MRPPLRRGPLASMLYGYMRASMTEVFQERARHLSNARQLVAGDSSYTSALALLAVHSAISWNDAVLVKLRGKPSSSQNHKDAVRATEQACRRLKVDERGITPLRKLLSEKSRVSYGGQRTTEDAALALAVLADRFEAWANGVLRS